MSRWIVCFAAAARVNVEAQTAEQAREAAERTLRAIGINALRINDVTYCFVDVSVTQEEQQ